MIKFITLFMIAQLFVAKSAYGYNRTPDDYRKKIVIIDTGATQRQLTSMFACNSGHLNVLNKSNALSDLNDKFHHGMYVFDIIEKQIDPEKYCITVIKSFSDNYVYGQKVTLNTQVDAIKHAISLNPAIINISQDGGEYYLPEAVALAKAVYQGTHVIISAGNTHANLSEDCNTFPACYPKMYKLLFKNNTNKYHVVAAIDTDKAHYQYYAYGGPVEATIESKYDVAKMPEYANKYNNLYVYGSSFSAPKYVSEVIKIIEKNNTLKKSGVYGE